MATTKKAITNKAPEKKVSKPIATKSKTSSNNPQAIFNIDEINLLLQAVNHSNVNELKLEKGDFKITIRQGVMVTNTPMSVAATSSLPITQVQPTVPTPIATTTTQIVETKTSSDAEISTDNLVTIKSPMIGTFYRSSGPGKPAFVNVGDDIAVGKVICIVEAMKLFNEIESEVNGKIVKVLVDDTSPVEYDQPLFLVQPS